MLALVKDRYARETDGEKQCFPPGLTIEASQEELDREAVRRFPRLVPYTAATEDEVIEDEIAALWQQGDATADAMLQQLESQRHRDGFERGIVGARVAAKGRGGASLVITVEEALEKLTGLAPVGMM